MIQRLVPRISKCRLVPPTEVHLVLLIVVLELAYIYRDEFGNTNYGVMRGCINCAGNKFENLIVKHSYQIDFKYVKGTAVDCQTVDTYPT